MKSGIPKFSIPGTGIILRSVYYGDVDFKKPKFTLVYVLTGAPAGNHMKFQVFLVKTHFPPPDDASNSRFNLCQRVVSLYSCRK